MYFSTAVVLGTVKHMMNCIAALTFNLCCLLVGECIHVGNCPWWCQYVLSVSAKVCGFRHSIADVFVLKVKDTRRSFVEGQYSFTNRSGVGAAAKAGTKARACAVGLNGSLVVTWDLSPREQTDTTENITFPQTAWGILIYFCRWHTAWLPNSILTPESHK